MRTTVDIPDHLYKELKTKAARQGSSVRSLIVEAVAYNLGKPVKRVRIEFPLIRGNGGPKINPTDEQIEEAVLG